MRHERIAVIAVMVLYCVIAANGQVIFEERWNSAPVGIYRCDDTFSGDEGTWEVFDTITQFPELGESPHTAQIVSEGGNHLLRLNSYESGTGAADNISADIAPVHVPITRYTTIHFKESGELMLMAPNKAWNTDLCLLPPCFESVYLWLETDYGNVIVYVFQREDGATQNLRHSNYREIFLDADAGSYDRNLYDDFSTIPDFNPNGTITFMKFEIADHGWATIDDIVISDPGPSIPSIGIDMTDYNFGNSATQKSFHVWNDGKGTLNYDVKITQGEQYFSVSPATGVSIGTADKKTHTVQINRDAMDSGQIVSGTLSVSSEYVDDGPYYYSLSAGKNAGPPDIRGKYTGSMNITISSCSPPDPGGSFVFTGYIEVEWQQGSSWGGQGVLKGTGYGEDVTETMDVSGTVDSSGNLSGSYAGVFTFDDYNDFQYSQNSGSFSGSVIGTKMVFNSTGQDHDVEGYTCAANTSFTGYRPGAPRIASSPLVIDFGTSDSSQTVEIWNAGTGTLNYSITVSQGSSYFHVSPASGSSQSGVHVTHTVTVERSSLPEGQSSGQLRIYAPDASNSPYYIPLSVQKTSPPVIVTDKDTIDFGDAEVSGTVYVWNGGGGTLQYDMSIDQGGDYFRVLPVQDISTGSNDKKLHTITVKRDNLPLGDTHASLIISSAQDGVSAKEIPLSAEGPAPVFSISGKVTDKNTGQPLAGLWVDCRHEDGVSGTWVVTDEQGQYVIEDMPPGEVWVGVWFDAGDPYARMGFDIDPLDRDITGLDFVLPAGASLSGKVIDIETGQPVPNVHVNYDSERYEAWADSGTNSEGEFGLTNLPPGVGEISAWPAVDSGYAVSLPWPASLVYIEEGEQISNRYISLRKGALVRGHVRDSAGQPLPSWMEIEWNGRLSGEWMDLDENGDYEIRLPVGKYEISLDSDEFGAHAEIVTVENVEQTIVADEIVAYTDDTGGQITGSFVNGGGYSWSGGMAVAAIEAGRALDDDTGIAESVSETEVTSAGPFSLTKLPPGNYDVYLAAWVETEDDLESFAIRDSVLNVPVGSSDVIVEYNSEGGTLRGSVCNSYGRAILGAEVFVASTSNGEFAAFAETDADGTYVISNVAPGSYDVTARHAKYNDATVQVVLIDGGETKAPLIMADFSGEGEGADVNGDGAADVRDLALFGGQWLNLSPAAGDFDKSGMTDMGDFGVVGGVWQWKAVWCNSVLSGGIPSLDTSKPSYAVGEEVVVIHSNAEENGGVWIGLYKKGAADGSYLVWVRTNRLADGSVTFAGLSEPGEYEARMFFHNAFDLAATVEFTVEADTTPSVTTSKSGYAIGEEIVVIHSNAEENGGVWIGLYRKGAADGAFLTWSRTNKLADGSVTFAGLSEPGEYEARMFFHNAFDLAATVEFTVEADTTASLTTSKSGYAIGEEIVVIHSNAEENGAVWIAVYRKGAPNGAFLTWSRTNGLADGSVTFAGLNEAGEYEARMFFNNVYDLAAVCGFQVN